MRKLIVTLAIGAFCFFASNVSQAQPGSAEEIVKAQAQKFSEADVFENADTDANLQKAIVFAGDEPAGTVKCWGWYYRPVYRFWWRPWYYRPYYVYHRYVVPVCATPVVQATIAVSPVVAPVVAPVPAVAPAPAATATAIAPPGGSATATASTTTGAVVAADPAPSTPMAAKGLRKGDVITAINGKPIKSLTDLKNITADTEITFHKGSNVKYAGNLLKNGDEEFMKSFTGMQEVEAGTLLTKAEIKAGNFDMYKFFEQKTGPSFGVRAADNNGNGVKVTEVVAGQSGQKAGFEVNDVILEINGTKIGSESAYSDAIDRAGSVARMKIICGKTNRTLDVDVMLNK
ncbi:MAG: PDZ domain-containing protein [Planctomycetaceae bacterium]|nr:PDZ domain-containing protein [Planctomycetaceae bacterium]